MRRLLQWVECHFYEFLRKWVRTAKSEYFTAIDRNIQNGNERAVGPLYAVDLAKHIDISRGGLSQRRFGVPATRYRVRRCSAAWITLATALQISQPLLQKGGRALL